MKKPNDKQKVILLVAITVSFSMAVFFDLFLRGTSRYPMPPEWEVAGGDADRGRQAIERYGCGACHVIPGVRGARGRVGPKLEDFINQIYIAGQLANVPENLVAFLQNPDEFSPGTAMPDLGITEEEARDIASYLYSVR